VRDSQRPGQTCGHSGSLTQLPLQLRNRGTQIPHQRLAEKRQLDPPTRALEQLPVQPPLDMPDRLAHMGRRHTQPLCRPPEMKLVSQDENRFELTQLDPTPHAVTLQPKYDHGPRRR